MILREKNKSFSKGETCSFKMWVLGIMNKEKSFKLVETFSTQL